MTTPQIVDAKHVTREEAERVSIFAMNVGEALSLPGYQYSVMVDPADDEALASIETVTHRHLAQISLNADWMNRTDDERMNCIVHEVLHLIHRDLDFAVGRFEPLVHAHEFAAVWTLYRREAELMVDYLAMYMSNFTTIKAGWADSLKEARKVLKK